MLSNECKLNLNKYSIKWDIENPFYENSNFSSDFKILTIKNEFLKEGDFIFSIRLFYDSVEIDNLILDSKFKIDKVNIITNTKNTQKCYD